MLSRSVLALVALALWSSASAHARQAARCFTTDDGAYDCTFEATDKAGSFEISAPGKPTFSLVMDEPGIASGFADFGTGSAPLPGRFLRSSDDRACWVNDSTGTRICAW